MGSFRFEKLDAVSADDLDEIVHDAASALASNANNGGKESQLEFLVTTCGWSEKEIISACKEEHSG